MWDKFPYTEAFLAHRAGVEAFDQRRGKDVGRSASLFVVVGMVLVLMASTVQTQSASLEMAACPDRITLGEPVAFIITKTNLLPSDLEWSVKDIPAESVEFVSAAPSQGTCTLRATGTSLTRKAV